MGKVKCVKHKITQREVKDYDKTFKAIRESEERFRKQFEESLDAIFIADAKTGLIVDCNNAALKLVGRKRSEIIYKHQGTIHPPKKNKNKEVFTKTFRQHLKGKEGQILESQVVTKKGQIKDVAIKANVFTVKGRKMLQGIFRDITEGKKADRLLKESEENFRTLAENSIDGILITVGRDKPNVYANKRAAEITGYNISELLETSINDLAPLDEFRELMEKYKKASLEGGGVRRYDTVILRKGGESIPIELAAAKTIWQGKVADIVFFRDITERKRAERALKNEKNKLQKYFDTAGIIIIILDQNQNILLINKRGSQILGYPINKIVGKNWLNSFIPKKNRLYIKEVLEKLMKGRRKKDKYFECPVLGKSGRKRTIGWYNTVLTDDTGHAQAILATGGDITHLRRAEGTIERLKELDKLKDEFLNISTHELKTPLTSIVGLSEILKSKNSLDEAERKKYINIIYEEGVRLSNIVKKVLTVTRFESGREIIFKERIDLPAFILSLLSRLNILAKKKNSRIVVSSEKESLIIKSDKEKIAQLIYNFVDNAFKYGPEKQIITISVTLPRKGWVKIGVIDQGKGIPKEMRKRLFTKFSQLEPSLSRSQEGTGLGLYICKLIAKELGGKVGVKSKLGEGSTFYFTCPIG